MIRPLTCLSFPPFLLPWMFPFWISNKGFHSFSGNSPLQLQILVEKSSMGGWEVQTHFVVTSGHSWALEKTFHVRLCQEGGECTSWILAVTKLLVPVCLDHPASWRKICNVLILCKGSRSVMVLPIEKSQVFNGMSFIEVTKVNSES